MMDLDYTLIGSADPHMDSALGHRLAIPVKSIFTLLYDGWVDQAGRSRWGWDSSKPFTLTQKGKEMLQKLKEDENA